MINIPLPTPKEDETQSEYVSRCVSFVFREGTLRGDTINPKNPDDRKRATAACYQTWRNKNKSEDDISKCIRCGLRDKAGYFCRYGEDGERFYYDTNDTESKKLAKSKAEEFGLNLAIRGLLKSISVEEKSEDVKVDKSSEVIGKENYIVPKSKDELKSGDIVNYKDKIGKIVKVI